MLTIRGVLSTLWLIAAGWLSPSQAATPASAAATLKPGTIVINPQFDWAGSYGIRQFDRAGSFGDGLGAVSIGIEWGFVDKTGHYVITPQFRFAGGFSDGLAAVTVGDNWGFIDKTGHYVINPQFNFARSFSEGLAAVRIGDSTTGKWGFIAR